MAIQPSRHSLALGISTSALPPLSGKRDYNLWGLLQDDRGNDTVVTHYKTIYAYKLVFLTFMASIHYSNIHRVQIFPMEGDFTMSITVPMPVCFPETF